jgi:OFA family oxalate/formate antiporter-like MFS transporter
MEKQTNLSKRWWILAAGVITMLFAGILYAWSILKTPFAAELGYEASALALCFTLAMSFFCLGGFVSGRLVRRIGTRLTIIFAGLLAGVGFVLTSRLGAECAPVLYLTYSFFSGSGIGIAYIVIISTVNAWFPDRRGLSSGALMMGFGASTLLLGKIADALFASSVGWRNTYVIIGIAIAVVIILSSFAIKSPDKDTVLPEKKKNAKAKSEAFEARDYAPSEMVRRFTFWRAFIALTCLTAVGSSVISFARDLALSVGAEAALATTLVGVLAVCNGLGRIITGAVFDGMGRRFTMIAANLLTICAAAVTLVAVSIGSLPLCIVGLCLTGLSYGSSPTVSAAFTSAFYGQKHFATNLSISNFNLMVASFIATACSSLQVSSGGYVAPFILLLSLAAAALALNISIKRP